MATQDAARLALIVCVLLAAFFGRLAWAWTFQAPSTARFSVRPVQCVATASVVVVILLAVRLFLFGTCLTVSHSWVNTVRVQFAQFDPPTAVNVCHLRNNDPTNGVCYHGG